MSAVLYRPILPDDFYQVVSLEQQLFDDAWQLSDLHELFNQHTATGFGGLGVYDGTNQHLLCYLLYQCLDVGEVLRLGTRPSHQGQGLASSVLRHWLDNLQGVCHCLLEVRADNTPAIALYQSLGFVVIHRRKAYYRSPDGLIDALVMQLALAD